MPGAKYRHWRCVPPVERLEGRRLFSAGGPGVQSSPPPTPIGAFLAGTRWTLGFRQYFAGIGGADVEYGTSWFGGNSGPVSWVNVDQVSIRFSQNVVVESRHLRVFGTNVAEYPVSSFRYALDTTTYYSIGTWTLTRPLAADQILLELDADNPQGVRTTGGYLLDGDRDGQAGGDFRLRFESLPGAFGGARSVGPAHVKVLRQRIGRSAEDVGVWPDQYSVGSDVNGDGRINVIDVTEVRRRVGTTVPYWEPTGAVAVQSSTPFRTRPLTRSLFSSTPVLP